MQLQVWWYCYRDDGSTKAGTGNISLKAFQIIWNANISGETEVPRGDRGLMICCRKYRKENYQKLSLFLFQGFWWKFFFIILLLVGFAINIPPRPHSNKKYRQFGQYLIGCELWSSRHDGRLEIGSSESRNIVDFWFSNGEICWKIEILCVTAFDREETENDLNHFQSFLAEFYWAVWGKRPASKYHFYEMVINFKLKYILVCRCDGCDGLMVIWRIKYMKTSDCSGSIRARIPVGKRISFLCAA